MLTNLNNPGDFPGNPYRRNDVDDQPVQPVKPEIITPGDPMEIDKGEDYNDTIGDREPELGNDHEKPHPTQTPGAEFDDGIRDGDRQAFDEIIYDDEDDHPRQD